MTKWKWWLAAHLRAKVCILNENGDYFYLDYSNWRTVLTSSPLGRTSPEPTP